MGWLHPYLNHHEGLPEHLWYQAVGDFVSKHKKPSTKHPALRDTSHSRISRVFQLFWIPLWIPSKPKIISTQNKMKGLMREVVKEYVLWSPKKSDRAIVSGRHISVAFILSFRLILAQHSRWRSFLCCFLLGELYCFRTVKSLQPDPHSQIKYYAWILFWIGFIVLCYHRHCFHRHCHRGYHRHCFRLPLGSSSCGCGLR